MKLKKIISEDYRSSRQIVNGERGVAYSHHDALPHHDQTATATATAKYMFPIDRIKLCCVIIWHRANIRVDITHMFDLLP